jgi:hypothetical protein
MHSLGQTLRTTSLKVSTQTVAFVLHLAEFFTDFSHRHCRGLQRLPPSGSLILNHQLVRSSEKNLRGQVPPLFAAQGTIYRYGLKGELSEPGRHIAAASLARDNNGLSISRHLEHVLMIGE